jgi:hypothetical protein
MTSCGLRCVDLRSDDGECGGCGIACGAGERCVNFSCYAHDCGDGYWLVSQNCYNSACATPGTAGDSCTFDPPHCGDHCYDSDAMWNVWYTEYYEGTYACDCSSGDLTYFGPGCPGHW